MLRGKENDAAMPQSRSETIYLPFLKTFIAMKKTCLSLLFFIAIHLSALAQITDYEITCIASKVSQDNMTSIKKAPTSRAVLHVGISNNNATNSCGVLLSSPQMGLEVVYFDTFDHFAYEENQLGPWHMYTFAQKRDSNDNQPLNFQYIISSDNESYAKNFNYLYILYKGVYYKFTILKIEQRIDLDNKVLIQEGKQGANGRDIFLDWVKTWKLQQRN